MDLTQDSGRAADHARQPSTDRRQTRMWQQILDEIDTKLNPTGQTPKYKTEYTLLAAIAATTPVVTVKKEDGQQSQQQQQEQEQEHEPRAAGKRPVRAISLNAKLIAIRRVHNGESKASVARDIGVPESTLRGWCKSEEKLLKQALEGKGTEIIVSSASESDRSTPGSSSRSPQSGSSLAAGGSTSGAGEEVEPFYHLPKRTRMENDLSYPSIPVSTSANIATSSARTSSQEERLYALYNLIMQLQPDTKLTPDQLAVNMQQQQCNVANAAALTLAMYQSALTSVGLVENGLQYVPSGLGTNGSMANPLMMGAMPTGMINPNKRKYNALALPQTQNISPKNSSKRQKSLSPATETRGNNGSSPTTSLGSNNSHVPATTPRSSKSDGKKIDGIAQQLWQQQQQQQQQQLLQQQQQQSSSQIFGSTASQQAGIAPLYTQDAPSEQMMPDCRVNHNNNTLHTCNHNATNDNSDQLPPGIDGAIENGTRFLNWVEGHGTPICTFQAIKLLREILETLTKWAKSKNGLSKKKANSRS